MKTLYIHPLLETAVRHGKSGEGFLIGCAAGNYSISVKTLKPLHNSHFRKCGRILDGLREIRGCRQLAHTSFGSEQSRFRPAILPNWHTGINTYVSLVS